MNIWHLMGWLSFSKGRLFLSSISYKLCDTTGYTYDMEVYAGKYRKHATRDMRVTHAPQLTRWVKGCGHKLCMDSYFSSPDLYSNLTEQKINYCGTIRQNHKGIPDDFGGNIQKLKQDDVRVRSSGDMTAVVCKDKCDMHMLSNIHDPPVEGNFCEESGNALKLAIVEDYNRYVGYVNKCGRMGNTSCVSRYTWKWTKKLFFRPLDLAMLNSHILLESFDSKFFTQRLQADTYEEYGRACWTIAMPTTICR